jgi:multidrug resistance efflux pump
LSAADTSGRLADECLPTDSASGPTRQQRCAEDGRPPADASRPQQLLHFVRFCGKTAATLAILGSAVLASLVIWDIYVTQPWTRDGRIRVQVASVAPQVSGEITELRVVDNQYVNKGEVLYIIDPFDFQVAFDQAKQQLAMKAADADVKKREAQRRRRLTDLSTTPEEQQLYAGNAMQAQAAFELARLQVAQADINLKRTQVRSPVNGFVTNLLMRVGDYAHAGTTNISVIDANSYWIDGYFEETKLANVCAGDLAEAQLMGYPRPILGRVETVTRGISVSDATPSTQGLPSVNPIYTWVRLAQRVPVRITITDVPRGVPLVSGLTATVTVRDADGRERGGRLLRPLRMLLDRVRDVFRSPPPRPSCIQASYTAYTATNRAGPTK